ncbi:hypothetical protein [Pontimicrobium aquaticum]|uniref:Uncharacterized protein n=1 Tax=Pontimicrobium aquaticum TaxID=2565367 RepID=A0A4U0EZ66_9FLAO|nr:hypothetical protein [Pontimicrobium aquaticum]TJY37346.1 hypothetical protein E5167_05205 [Pontimicrobium aquaticum]
MKVKTPDFKFFIFNLILVLILNACNKEVKSLSLNYLNNPKIGDVYFVDYGENNFSSIKITTINNDSISFVHSESIINPARFVDESVSYMKNIRVKETNNSRFYKDSIVKYSRKDILQQFDNQKIYNVVRVLSEN